MRVFPWCLTFEKCTFLSDFDGYLGKLHGSANPYTVEILYRLGTTQDQNTQIRLEQCPSFVKLVNLPQESLLDSYRNKNKKSALIIYDYKSIVSKQLEKEKRGDCYLYRIWSHLLDFGIILITFHIFLCFFISFWLTFIEWTRYIPLFLYLPIQ